LGRRCKNCGMMHDNAQVPHDAFMTIFEFCDTSTAEECIAEKALSDDAFDTQSGIARRLAILSKIHEALYGVPSNKCKVGALTSKP
jgi:hypothetical protein